MNYPGYAQPRVLDPNVHSLQRTREIEQLRREKADLEKLISLTHRAARLFPGAEYSVKGPSAKLRRVKARLRELGAL